MKKTLLFSLLPSMIVILFLAGCVSSEETENQAAQALAQLSDEELQGLEEETTKMEKSPIAGQVYRLPSSATINTQTAARLLQGVNRNSRPGLIQVEKERRRISSISIISENCETDSDCGIGQKCNEVCAEHVYATPPNSDYCQRYHKICENVDLPIDSRCERSYECSSDLLCLYDSIQRAYTCLPGQGCLRDTDCNNNNLCIRTDALSYCTSANRNVGDPCSTYAFPSGSDADRVCASNFCGYNGRQWTCEETDRPIGSPCTGEDGGREAIRECASNFCGFNGKQWVCEVPNRPTGSACTGKIGEDPLFVDGQYQECASGECNYWNVCA